MSLSDHPEFIAGNVNTDFIKSHHDKLFEFSKQLDINNETVCCSLIAYLNHENESSSSSDISNFWTNSIIQKEFNILYENKAKSSKQYLYNHNEKIFLI
jgi:acetyl/propionyl-CoA carboxylase alpha subunit